MSAPPAAAAPPAAKGGKPAESAKSPAAKDGKTGLFVTCIAEVMRPQIARAAAALMAQSGAPPVVPAAQTCCGQPAYNAGFRALAKKLAQKTIGEFAHCARVVVPSGSCCAHLRLHAPTLFEDDGAAAREEAAQFAKKCRELSQFLEEQNFTPQKSGGGAVAYHDSCAGLRELGIKEGPRRLLRAAGFEVCEMKNCEECCGFGGAFAAKFGAVSSQMAAEKCAHIAASGAPMVAMGDGGCLLNIAGKLHHEKIPARAVHYAELLAGESGAESTPESAAASESEK